MDHEDEGMSIVDVKRRADNPYAPTERELRAYAAELERLVRKYQARYHGAPHAQKLWNEVEELLKRAPL
jgi:hypothetical protein